MGDQLDYKQLKGTPIILALSNSPSSAPSNGYMYLYPRSGKFYQMDDGGNEKEIDFTAIEKFYDARRLVGLLVQELMRVGIKIENEELVNQLNFL